MTHPIHVASGLLLLAVCACAKPPPPTCTSGEGTACFTGVFSNLFGKRLEGVRVCAPELPEVACTRSDEDGGWKLPGLPLDSDVLVTATYEDMVPTAFPQHTSMDWYDWYKVLAPQSVMNSNANRLDVSLRDKRGHFLFMTWEGLNIDHEDTPNVSGVTLSLTPSGLTFYGDGLTLATKDRTDTSGSGSGGAVNLEPGTYTARFVGPQGPCREHAFHYLADGANIPIPVLAGFTTAIDVICDP